MALQSSDYFLVNRAGTSYKVDWNELQTAQEGSLRIEDVWDYTVDGNNLTVKANSSVPLDVDRGIRLPVAGTGDYNEDGAIRYSPDNSKIELYYDGAWNTASGGTAFSATPPVPATVGDVWYDTDNGRAYVYYDDGTSQQWVEMNPAWDGGVPPDTITTELILDGAVTPAKLSPGRIEWNAQGYHAIGQGPDTTARLTIRSTNANTSKVGLRLTQANTTNTRTQYLELEQHEAEALSVIKADNSNTNATLKIIVGSSTKLTFPESGNITTSAPLQSSSGFIGNVTGDLNGVASEIKRDPIVSTDANQYRVVLGEANDISGGSSCKVVTNRASLTYRPSTDTLTAATFAGNLSGTASNSNLLGNEAPTSYFRVANNNTVSGVTTFNNDINFNDFSFFKQTARFNDNVRVNFGNSNDVEFFFNGSDMYTDLNAGNYFIRDNNTTRFTFGRASGSFTATGNITAPTFVGALNGNASSATVSGTSTTTNHINVSQLGSIDAPIVLGDNRTPSNNQEIYIDSGLYWSGSDNTLKTENIRVTGHIDASTIQDPNFEGGLTEDIYTIPWSSSFNVNSSTASMQLVVLSGSSTPTATFGAGQTVTLMVGSSSSSYFINWGSMDVRWVGGNAPEITSESGAYTVLQLWKVNTNRLYGAIVGDVN